MFNKSDLLGSSFFLRPRFQVRVQFLGNAIKDEVNFSAKKFLYSIAFLRILLSVTALQDIINRIPQ